MRQISGCPARECRAHLWSGPGLFCKINHQMLRVTLYETLANCDEMCLKLSVADAGGHPGAKEIKALHKGTFGAGGTTFTSATHTHTPTHTHTITYTHTPHIQQHTHTPHIQQHIHTHTTHTTHTHTSSFATTSVALKPSLRRHRVALFAVTLLCHFGLCCAAAIHFSI